MKIVIIGGGPSGFSAAMVAKKVGAEVTVVERTDMLGGLGLVAGVAMPGSAISVFTEEKALGGADLADIFDAIATHKLIVVPGVGEDVTLYNPARLDSRLQKALSKAGVEFMLRKTVVNTEMSNNKINAVILQDGTRIIGDAFIDATGATEGPKACNEWGRGCVECILRCPTFGPPGGVVEKKVKTVASLNSYGKPGVTGTSVLISKASLSPIVEKQLNENGYAIIPVPSGVTIDEDRMKRAGMPLYFRHDIHKKNIILVDLGGVAKSLAAGGPMYAGSLRSFTGLEDAFIIQPNAGAIGHLVSWTTMAYRDNSLKVDGFENLFCAGHKAGPLVSLLAAIVTGDLAGYNAVKWSMGQDCLELPGTLMVGAFIDYVGQQMRSEEGLKRRYGTEEIELLKELKVYRKNRDEIIKEVENVGLKGVYQTKLCG